VTSSSQISDGRVWCELCNDHVRFVSIHHATLFGDVSRRTIYRYIDSGKIRFFKLAGTGQYRVCSGCLLSQSKPTDD
jgi:predicted DNA-binding transcriptional regulator YafY